MNTKLLKVGIIGTVLSAICCFTPALVVAFSLLGLTAAMTWLDSILIPSLVFFIGISIYALVTKNTPRSQEEIDT